MGDSLNFRILSRGPAGSYADITGSFPADSDSTLPSRIVNLYDCTLSGALFNFPLETAALVVPPELEFGGRLTADFSYRNRRGRIERTGAASVSRGTITIREMGERFVNINMTMTLSDSLLMIPSFRANASNGTLTAGGSMRMNGFFPAGFNLNITATDLTILSNAQLTILSDLDAKLSGDIGGRLLSGNVTMKNADFGIKSLQGNAGDRRRDRRTFGNYRRSARKPVEL